MTLAAKSKNLVIAMSLFGAALLSVHRWLVPALFDLRPLRDGAKTYTVDDPRLRSVVFGEPSAFGGELESAGNEGQIALSRDGRWLAFVAGTVGQNSELFVAELDGEVVGTPRAIAELNSGADEIAPAFGAGVLYFASNRGGGAGGFDLYVASWDGHSFGEPRAVDGGVNTVADEVDPAPTTEELIFSSNRGDGFDLYSNRVSDEDGRAAVVRLDALSSAFDDREPSVSNDGRALYFASERARGGGDFDVWRSFRDNGVWLEPELLAGPSTLRSERAPRLAHDGFTLIFQREGDPGAELWSARTIELFHGAQGARGWADLMLLVALLLLALVAALSKRWEELDLLYKCLLVSVLLHLLLMFLLRDVRPDAEHWPVEQRREPTFRVRLEGRREAQRSLAERSGQLEANREERVASVEPQRAELANAEAPNDTPTPLGALERSRSNEELTVERGDVEFEPLRTAASIAAPEIEVPSESRTRLSASAQAPELAEPIPSARERSGEDVAGPVAHQMERPREVDDTATLERLAARRTANESDPPSTRFAPAELAPTELRGESHVGPTIEMQSEPRTRLALRENDVAPRAAQSFEAARSNASDAAAQTPERGEFARRPEHEDVDTSSAPVNLALEPRRAPESIAAPSIEPSTAHPTRTANTERAPTEVAAPVESVARRALQDSPESRSDSIQPLELKRERQAGLVEGPSERPNDAAAPNAASLALDDVSPPSSRPLEIAPRERDESPPAAPARLHDTPYRSRFGTEKEVALREHGGTRETELAVARGLRYLAAQQTAEGAWGETSEFHTKYRDVRVGKSALALLAFLGAGHTPTSNTEFSAVSEAAVRWLLSTQDRSTGHFGDSEAYSHGIATYALAECFAITSDERLRGAVERAIEQILRHQATRGGAQRVGGWSYYYPDGATYDSWPRTSITSWQVMALESARLGGLAVPDAAFEAAHAFLIQAWDEQLGRFRYSHDPARLRSGYPTLPGSTPAALFALALLGEDLAADTWSDAIRFLGACAPRGYRWEGEDAFVQRAGGNLYFWYYGSLALLRRGDAPWERWNTALKATLLPAQAPDGSWAPIDVYCEYAGDSESERVYSTAMCVLSLEVYYRYFTPLLKVR